MTVDPHLVHQVDEFRADDDQEPEDSKRIDDREPAAGDQVISGMAAMAAAGYPASAGTIAISSR